MKAIAITTHKSSFQGLTLPDDFYMRIQKAQIKLDKLKIKQLKRERNSGAISKLIVDLIAKYAIRFNRLLN